MKEPFYLYRNTALINYTTTYHRTADEMLSSDNFKLVLENYLQDLKSRNAELYSWVCRGLQPDVVSVDCIRLLKVLMVLNIDEINHPYLKDKETMLVLIEDCYQYWRKIQRYSIIYTTNEEGLQLANFIDSDTQFNQMILGFYRSIQEKVQGRKNRVYRQLQAGTNASLLLRNYSWKMSEKYVHLKKIPFINSIMMRTPLILHPRSNKRIGSFDPTDHNPIEDFSNVDIEDWMCYPCKVGSLTAFLYFHRDFTSSAVALANLFELAADSDCIDHKPDLVLLFGIKDNKDECVYYHDTEEDIWVGKVSYADVIEYFGYLKKMSLTLHNLAMIQKGWLPLHGAMINVHLKDGRKKGIIMIGDSGAGKSETIEALQNLGNDEIIDQEIIFDDMGSLHLEEGELYAQGTEIGAFVRLDDLDKGSAYRDMDRSIFFNPESSNARVVLPAASYQSIVSNHRIDMFMYANNYTDSRGLRKIDSLDEAKAIFVEGKRFALGTTQEKGISTTYFANPFGPMQRQADCDKIIDQLFVELFNKNIFVGEIYTCLGLPDKGDNGLAIAGKQLLETIKKL